MEVTDADPKNKDKIKSKYVARTPVDLQRIKVEKLMEHPEKPVVIPMSNKQKNFMAAIPTFVRNVMGSSAGAGSGEFHVYRHLRRKEYARQKHIQHKSRQEELDDEYQQRLESNRINSESKTAKKRAKRQKRKLKTKKKTKGSAGEVTEPKSDAEDENEDSEDDDDEGIPTEKKAKPSDEEDSNDVPIAETEAKTVIKEYAIDVSAHEESGSDAPCDIVSPKDGPFVTVVPKDGTIETISEKEESIATVTPKGDPSNLAEPDDSIAEAAETIAGCAERAVLPATTET